jgi:hypothetical protein
VAVVLSGEDADSKHRGAAQLLWCAVASPWRGARRAQVRHVEHRAEAKVQEGRGTGGG